MSRFKKLNKSNKMNRTTDEPSKHLNTLLKVIKKQNRQSKRHITYRRTTRLLFRNNSKLKRVVYRSAENTHNLDVIFKLEMLTMNK